MSAIQAVVEFLFSAWEPERWPITMTFKLDLDSVKVNQHATHLPQGPQLLPRHTDTHTHWTDCSYWNKKVIGNEVSVCTGLYDVSSCCHSSHRPAVLEVWLVDMLQDDVSNTLSVVESLFAKDKYTSSSESSEKKDKLRSCITESIILINFWIWLFQSNFNRSRTLTSCIRSWNMTITSNTQCLHKL